jgi:hypothetical protein
VKYVYYIVMDVCLAYITRHYLHWPFGACVLASIFVLSFAFFVASLVEDDRK